MSNPTFEQQVGDALKLSPLLAERVAAAIEATVMADRQANAATHRHLSTRAWHEVAITALRGDHA